MKNDSNAQLPETLSDEVLARASGGTTANPFAGLPVLNSGFERTRQLLAADTYRREHEIKNQSLGPQYHLPPASPNDPRTLLFF